MDATRCLCENSSTENISLSNTEVSRANIKSLERKARKRRIELSLEKKVDVLNKIKKNIRYSEIASQFSVSKTQISNIWKNRDVIQEQFQTFSRKEGKRLKSATPFEEINILVKKWFDFQRSRNVPISGTIIKQKAKEIANLKGIQEFEGSNGWLEKWRRKYRINFKNLCGESADVNINTIEDWKCRISQICNAYKPCDIYNGDETGLFHRTLPSKSLVNFNEKCSGGKQSKERVTVFVCCNASGEKEKLIVIGKYQNPRAFKSLNSRNFLPVKYRNSSNAWMTSSIFIDWLDSFNKKMAKDNRNVLLLLDNASCHYVTDTSNVKVCFLPPNTTSCLQPIDQGIIASLKAHYRKMVVNRIILLLDSNQAKSCRDLTKEINILDCCSWLSAAWSDVKRETITKCFAKCGINVEYSESVEETIEFPELILNGITSAEYINCDNELQTSEVITDWNEYLNSNVIFESESNTIELSDESKCEQEDEIISNAEALTCWEKLKKFAVQKNFNISLQMFVNSRIQLEKDIFSSIRVRQSRIDEYFNN